MIYRISLSNKNYTKSMDDGEMSDYEILDILCTELDYKNNREVFINEQQVSFYKDNVLVGTYTINRHTKKNYSIQEI